MLQNNFKRFGAEAMNLKEFSDILGLSQTTVSRALNGYPEVKEATRDRIFKAAREHGYKPNSRAQSLATGKARAIGHVLPIATKHEMVNPIFGDFISGAGEVYSRNGYEMVLSIVDDQDEDRAYRQFKSRGSVDGVVVHAPKMNDPRIALLEEIGMPFVVHGRSTEERSEYSWVDVNNRRAFRRATEFLIDLGHRRIGLVNGLESMDFAQRRRDGYETALTDRGIALDADLRRSDEMTEGYGFRAATEMLELPQPATAFLVSSMICALGVRRAIEKKGLTMGRDVSVVIHDDVLSYLANGDDVPIFTATRSSVREAGKIAAQMLIDKINDPLAAPQSRLLETDLILGQSTGPLLA